MVQGIHTCTIKANSLTLMYWLLVLKSYIYQCIKVDCIGKLTLIFITKLHEYNLPELHVCYNINCNYTKIIGIDKEDILCDNNTLYLYPSTLCMIN